MSEYRTPRHKIAVNQELCGDAIKCLKCVHTCLDHGPNCLGFVNQETPSLDENAPKRLEDIPHRIVTIGMYMCDGCQECIKVCPKDALTFIPAKLHQPRAVIRKASYNVNCTVLADGTVVGPDYEEEIVYIKN